MRFENLTNFPDHMLNMAFKAKADFGSGFMAKAMFTLNFDPLAKAIFLYTILQSILFKTNPLTTEICLPFSQGK